MPKKKTEVSTPASTPSVVTPVQKSVRRTRHSDKSTRLSTSPVPVTESQNKDKHVRYFPSAQRAFSLLY